MSEDRPRRPRSWRDLVDSDDDPRPMAAATVAPSAPASPPVPPGLRRLLEEREALEGRMRQLASGDPPGRDSRDAVRFPVLGLPERRAAIRAWEESRERRRQARADDSREIRRSRSAGDSEPAQPAPGGSSRRFSERVGDWARQRSEQLEKARERAEQLREQVAGVTARLDARTRRARDAARTVRAKADEILDLWQEKRDLQRESNDAAPESRLERGLDTALDLRQREREQVAAVQAAWTRQRDRLTDRLDLDAEFARRAARLLDVRVGSLEEVGERLERLRARGLARQRQRRAEERDDEARRQRALRRRRAGSN